MKLTRLLRYGMAGSDVKELQVRLIELKYGEYLASGNFGPDTLKSVKKFQNDNGLTVDGVIGNKTWSYLFSGVVTLNNNPIGKSTDKFNLKPSEITSNGLEIYDQIMDDSEYIKKKTKKKVIYLHHTAGSHRPDWTITSWGNDKSKDGSKIRIGTGYVIGRSSKDGDTTWDGKVFRAFDDDYWCYHLGIKNNNESRNSEAIGIEICNYGWVKKLPSGEFITYVGSSIPSSDVTDLGEEWRGHRYCQKYTDTQIESLRKLIVYLMDKHDIEIEHGIYDMGWFSYDDKYLLDNQEGIRTHVNVRRDKTDCHPQKELIDMLNSL